MKRRTFLYRLCSMLCIGALLMALLPAAVTASPDHAPSADHPYTLMDEILERDGFIDGIWYPWLFAAKNGRSLCGNKVMAQFHGEAWATAAIDEMGADVVYRGIYNLKTMGYNMMAYGGSMYGEGVIFDQYGDVLGVEQEYLDNMRRFLDICRAAEMPVMWNIYFHASTIPEYYSSSTWNFLSQMIANPTISRHFAERYVAPVCEVLAEYPDVVAMVSIADEPENEINDSEKGKHFSGGRSCYGTTVENMRNFMWDINETVKEKLPGMPRTVTSNDQNKTLYRDFALDLMGHNRYDNMSNAPTVDAYVTYADMIMAEYNVGDEFPGGDEALAEALIRYRQNMMDRGYKGGFQWCWLPNHVAGSCHYLIVDPTDNTAFRETVALLHYFMNDYRAAHRGETVGLEPAVLYANSDDGKVEWIPSRQGVTVDLLRSDDGGRSWFTVAKGVEQSPPVDMGKAVYRDTTQKPDSGYIYKVITYDADGNSVASAPNDPAGTAQTFVRESKTPVIDYPTNTKYEKAILTKKEQADLISFGVENNRVYLPELNLIENGSFEELSGDAGQWCNRDFLCEYLGLVDDNTNRYQVPDGNSCLMLDTRQVPDGLWRKFTVKGLEKNTDYVFSVWVKGTYLGQNNACDASIGVIDPDTGTFMVYWDYYRGNARASRHTEQIYPPCWDNEWHLRSVMFNSGDHTSCEIGLYGAGSVMYVDDMQLFKNGDGIKYSAGKNDSLQTNFLWDPISCDPADSLTDVTVDADDFWQTGDGWKQGFMSVKESNTGYGNALKYTQSEDPHGLYYLKWIDVEPNTQYYLSFYLKIQESGAGRVMLMDGKLTGPGDAFSVDLDAEVYGNDWFNYYGKFNSGAYDKVAFGVIDQGGSALIDNIRIFKVEDENGAQNLFVDDNQVTNKVGYGKTASVTVNAEGDGLKYQWYFKDKTNSKFYLTTSFTGKTYSTKMDATRDGRQVYCVVTDKYGTSRKTAVTTLTMKPTALKITTQPKTSTYVKDGVTAKVTVKAQGDGLKYTWYYKNAGKTSYSKSSVTSATYSVKMSASASDRRLYCVVTDAYGNSVKTTTAVIRRQVAITKQPATAAYAKNGAKASVKITANGDGLKYAWYVKNAGASKYSKSSITSATYSATMSSTVKDRRVYCVVTDKYGKSVTSKTFILRMVASITTEPKTVTVKKNATAKLTVKAKGDGLKYTWYVKNEGAKKYSKSSITKSTYSVKMTSKVKNRLVYCVVTDKYGNKVQSKTARLKMK